MEQLTFHYKSKRAVKARLARRLQGTWVHVLTAMFFVSLFAGIALLASSQPIGWFIFGIAALPAMIVGWYEGELKPLEPARVPKTIDDALAGDILSQLPAEPTPKDIAAALGQSQSGFFFAARFGVTA